MINRSYQISLYSMTAFYVGAGANHFLNPEFYTSVMPDLPQREFLNAIGGVAEIILGFLLLPELTRRFAAWMIIAMLTVFFFVIHIPMCFMFYGNDDFMFWIAVVRIPLQLVLINWAWRFAKNRSEQSSQ